VKRRRAFSQKAAGFYPKGGGLLLKRRRAFTQKAASFLTSLFVVSVMNHFVEKIEQ
jgi:hypothetical protein